MNSIYRLISTILIGAILLTVMPLGLVTTFSIEPTESMPYPNLSFANQTFRASTTASGALNYSTITHILSANGKELAITYKVDVRDATDSEGVSGISLYHITGYKYDGKEYNEPGVFADYRLRVQPASPSLPGQGQSAPSGQQAVNLIKLVTRGSSNSCGSSYDFDIRDNSSHYCLNRASTNLDTRTGRSTMLGWYVALAPPQIRDNKPRINQGSSGLTNIPQECKDLDIKPESELGWQNLNEITAITNSIINTEATDDNKQKIQAKNQFANPYTDQAADIRLYKTFYKDGASYSNQHLTTDNQVSVYQTAEFKEIQTLTTEDLGEGYKAVKKVEQFIGASVLVGGVAATAGAAATYKIGGKEAIKKVGQAVAGKARTFGPKIASAATSGVGLYTIVGIIAIEGTMYGVGAWASSKNRDFMKSFFESLMAEYYASKHVEFHQCIQDKANLDAATAADTDFTPEVLANEKKILAAWDSENQDMAPSADAIADDEPLGGTHGCPGTAAMFKQPISWAFCRVLAVFWDIVVTGIETALGWTEKAMLEL